ANLGDREAALRSAVAALPEVLGVSGVYETEPVGGPAGQPSYLNVVVELSTALTGRGLLDVAQRLEAAAGRDRSGEERHGPRPLDVDVLWIEGEAVDDDDLTVPHPRMFERRFVLAPLAELAPDIVPAGWEATAAGTVQPAGRL
ncbi:MAG TPA: 2-amino-4-hydroxy-6-hydroxymethyldihydropteridine diphosphokinase, partial [Acidimicrobiales bacterium]